MPEANQWLHKFTGYRLDPSFRKGSTYFWQGRVRLLEASERSVEARVRGSETYDVCVAMAAAGDVLVWCDCPAFDLDRVCKHIWATLHAAEEEGHLSDLRFVAKPHLVPQWDPENMTPQAIEEQLREQERAKREAEVYRWRDLLRSLHSGGPNAEKATEGVERRLYYLVDAPASMQTGQLAIRIATQSRKRNGSWGKPRQPGVYLKSPQELSDPLDRQIAAVLAGSEDRYGYLSSTSIKVDHQIPLGLESVLLPMMCQSGRLAILTSHSLEAGHPLSWDERKPWELRVEVVREDSTAQYVLTGWLMRDDEKLPLDEPELMIPGFLFTRTQISRVRDAFDWINLLRGAGRIQVPIASGAELQQELLRLTNLPELTLPPELHVEQATLKSPPLIRFYAPKEMHVSGPQVRVPADLQFDYDGQSVKSHQPGRALTHEKLDRLLLRDLTAENAAVARLRALSFHTASSVLPEFGWILAPSKMPEAVRVLLGHGWRVEAQGRRYRQPTASRVEVRSGVDWFEVHGRIDFETGSAGFPDLLRAIRRGDDVIQLDDGSLGLMPEEWLERYSLIAQLGETEDDHLRFRSSQAGLLDALLAARPEVEFDEAFARVRSGIRQFTGVAAEKASPTFRGELRSYQEDGLGWLLFLRKFGFGGCLADDMGLGKTIQVLALIDRLKQDRTAPILVVAPRSLIFNWKQEAERFTPRLRILDHSGGDRDRSFEYFRHYDIILATYGTLRRDAALLQDFQFDTAILDEAQAIKNANTESAKAARLLNARHRLALTGTPVENHLGELWSLFEFLNPGLLGNASVFKNNLAESESGRPILAAALRPFILRRTKKQVAHDLPPKMEQTIYCEFKTEQRRLYNELRDHYRNTLVARIEKDGMNKSKIQILEALLRLRQAACHPGLIDPKKAGHSSAKLDALLPQLSEVVEEGHKALVFSQFTSMLTIVRTHLDYQGLAYEYLDGRTRNRQEKVERFQSDSQCRLFLISLKAGGLGLNLTAAEYVFLLDPWWNPAVEAQAIDRAHRIGQTRQVFAYRLIARDTVEDKILELQQTKRDLADAIINADNSIIRNLSREHLELLLS